MSYNEGASLMKRFITGGLLGFAFIFICQGLAGAEGLGTPESGIRLKAQLHLFFVFSPNNPQQQIHARQLQGLASRFEDRLQVTGIVRPRQGEEMDAVGLEDLRTHIGLSYELLGVAAADLDPKVPVAVKDEFGRATDFVLLADTSGKPILVGDGHDLLQIVSALDLDPMRTEVEENTWGKIKQLFN